MIEKLLENWLDSATERSYQTVFVQMLSGQGYRVVHSTRHTALEYGKDILAIDQDGRGCAFQLKGHPGRKMTLSEFRDDVQPQMVQLMTQAVVFPGFPEGPHRAYLVTNGYFDEEVHRAVDDLNRMPYPSKVSLLSRGDLLKWSIELGTTLWPSELPDSRLMLELFLSDPRDLLPEKKLSQLIERVLSLDSIDSRLASKPAYCRAVTSATLLTGIVTAPFAEADNHLAVAFAWTLCAVSIVATAEKNHYKIDGVALETLRLAEAAIADALSQLWNDVMERKYLIEGNAFAEPEVFAWRYMLLLGVLTSLVVLHETCNYLNNDALTKLRVWLSNPQTRIDLWGESAVANLVPWLIWRRKYDATIRPDIEIAGLAGAVIARNQFNSQSPLASPYYAYPEIARQRLQLDKPHEGIASHGEAFAGSSFTAEPLMHLLVRTNLKQTCNRLWPDFTRIGHRVCLPEHSWEYCTLTVKSGADQTKIYPSTYAWTDLKTEATLSTNPTIPAELATRPWLLSLWWQVAPHRYTTEASRAFVENFFPGWRL